MGIEDPHLFYMGFKRLVLYNGKASPSIMQN